MSLEIAGLTKHYKSQKALDDVSLSIGRNEIIGLLGPNGAGKSTLMKTIAGVLDVEAGSVSFNDISVNKNAGAAKKIIGFLPENNPLYADMYVLEYLEFVASVHNIRRQRVEEVIEMVGITPERNKKISELSKGYRQRVGLAQAILHEPELLILDEPTNGLDPNQIVEIRNVIKKIGENKTVILSTHILQEVEALCSRVILINKGQIVMDLPVAEFKGKFESLEQAFQSYTATA